MKPVVKTIFLIILDLAGMLILLLVLAYYGMCHLFLLLSGLLFFCLCLYDSHTGWLAKSFALIFSLPEHRENGRLNWVPVLLSLVVVVYSLPLLLEHGVINEVQRNLMQGGLFPRFAAWATAATALIAAVAVYMTVSSRKKR